MLSTPRPGPFDVAIVSPRSRFTPTGPEDAPQAFARLRTIRRGLSHREAVAYATKTNAWALSLGITDPWATPVQSDPSPAFSVSCLLKRATWWLEQFSDASVEAGTLALAALETRLRELCEALDSPPVRRPTIRECSRALHSAGHLDAQAVRQILRLQRIGRRAAGNLEVDGCEMAELVSAVRVFVRQTDCVKGGVA